jgi:hypothetical protein
MRHRQERFLTLIGPNADSASVTEVDLAEAPGEATGEPRIPLMHIPADIGFTKPEELTWWDWTVFLLHTAAEIEHALMVQYIYAAYSLGEAPFQGPNVPEGAQTLVDSWRRTIVGIAREEMGHLITVQNLLRFIGGALNFEREDFPFRSLYPFPFQLEPLTKSSLAKYVAAEMPENPDQPDELMREIVERATGSAGGLNVNRVGPMYAELVTIFEDATKLSDNDLFPDTTDSFQAKGEDWGEDFGIIVRRFPPRLREDDPVAAKREGRAAAVEALKDIGAEGEGSGQPTDDTTSHFGRFIKIYKGRVEPPAMPPYPETDDWIPFRPVPTNPNTLISPSSAAHLEGGRITHPLSRLWAQLANVRYRMLLLDIAHALHLEGPTDGSLTMRDHLPEWAFFEMRGQLRAGLRGVSRRLVQLPLKAEGSSQEQAAALPFELPYTLALPDRDLDRWRLHLTLIEGASNLIAKIAERSSGRDDVLDELKRIDTDRQQRIKEHLTQL